MPSPSSRNQNHAERYGYFQTRRCVVVVSLFEVQGESTRWLAAGAVLARAALSLFFHGLVSFGQAGTLSRATGIVSRR